MQRDPLKPVGAWEVRRTFRVTNLDTLAEAGALKVALAGLAGVKAVSVDRARHRVAVRYDITRTDYLSIRNMLVNEGFPPPQGWWALRKANWIQGLDLTGRENAASNPSHCCNRPPRNES